MTEFFIDIENGGIVQKRLMRAKFCELIDGAYKIIIEKGKRRSLPQNAYLHYVMIPEFRKALISVGYRVKDDEQAKQIFKATFCTRHLDNENKDSDLPQVSLVRDTSTMSTKELSELFEEVIQFCAEHMNYQVPYPGEKLKLDLPDTK